MFEIPDELKGSHSKFREAALGAFKPIWEKVFFEHREEFGEITLNIITNSTGQKRLNRLRDSREEALSKVLEGFFEIESSYNSLNEAPFFLHRFPANLPSKSSYLEFVITSYLNEAYILSKRIEAYTTKIARLYKNSPHMRNKLHLLTSFNQKISEFFNAINNIRGHHVHEHRYQDDDLERLNYLELFVNNKTSLSKRR